MSSINNHIPYGTLDINVIAIKVCNQRMEFDQQVEVNNQLCKTNCLV